MRETGVRRVYARIFLSALIVLVAVAALVLFAKGVEATTWVVDDDGTPGVDCNYTTIQAAIDNASAGDTIQVAAGNYTENVVVNKTVSLVGENRSTTIIDAGGSGDVVNITSDWVNVSGLSIINGGPIADVDGGLVLSNADHCHIHDNNVSYNNQGIWLNAGSSHNAISDNIVFGNGQDGIALWSSSSNNVTNNTAFGNAARGVYLFSSDQCNVTDNSAYGNLLIGIAFVSSSNNSISFNNVTSNTNHGILLKTASNDNVVRGNNISSNGQYCVRIMSSGSNLVYNNNFIGNNGGTNQGYDDSTNDWNATMPYGGNHWSDHTSPDVNWDGIVDNPYAIGAGSGQDNYPWADPSGWTTPRPIHNVNSGLSYPTIQAAIAAANPGDTLIVNASNYNENVSVGKELSIVNSSFNLVGALTVTGTGALHLDNVSIETGDVIVTGALTLDDSPNTIISDNVWVDGSMWVNSSTWKFDCTSDGEFGLHVNATGDLVVQDNSSIVANQSFEYDITIKTAGLLTTINNGTIHDYIWYAANPGFIDKNVYYPTIQAAIDAASAGDTILVANGTYNENVVVNKTINLTGESREATVVNGGSQFAFRVEADCVNVSGFNITNGGDVNGMGIVLRSDGNNVSDNNFWMCGKGIGVEPAPGESGHPIMNSVFFDTGWGAYVAGNFDYMEAALEEAGWTVVYGNVSSADLALYDVVAMFDPSVMPDQPTIDAIQAFVAGGGGFMLNTRSDYNDYDSSEICNGILEALGISGRLNDDQMLDPTDHYSTQFYAPYMESTNEVFANDTLGISDGIDMVYCNSLATVYNLSAGDRVIMNGDDDAYNEDVDADPFVPYLAGSYPPVLVGRGYGAGRVVYGGMEYTLSDGSGGLYRWDESYDGSHLKNFTQNLVHWLGDMDNKSFIDIGTVYHAPLAPTGADQITFTANIQNSSALTGVTLYYAPIYTKGQDYAFQPVQMNDAGILGDAAAGDGNYTAQIPASPGARLVRYYVRAEDAVSSVQYKPYDAPASSYSVLVDGGDVYDVKVNEFLAAPASDWDGDAVFSSVDDEWIELYNAGTGVVDLYGLYLDDTDGGSSPGMIDRRVILWPGDFAVFYGSDFGSLGLNNAGDDCRLLDTDGIAVIDEYAYASPGSDVSWGRIADGVDIDTGADWMTYGSPTPGAPNDGSPAPPEEGGFASYPDGNTFYGNEFRRNDQGLDLSMSGQNVLASNVFAGNNYSLYIDGGDGNLVMGNTFDGNVFGVYLLGSSGNAVYHNDMIASPGYDDGSNVWNLSYAGGGNYWDGHTAPDARFGPSQDLVGADGIVDDPYAVPGGAGQDQYPFVTPQGWVSYIAPPGPVHNLDNGYDFYSIQEAIDNASAGHTIFIDNGTYDERPTINKTLNIIGESVNGTVIFSPGAGDVFKVTADWVNFTGLTVKKDCVYPPGVLGAGILFDGVQNCSVDDVYLDSCYEGVKLVSSSYCRMTNLTSWNDHTVVAMYDSWMNSVYDCVVNYSHETFMLYNATENELYGNVMTNATYGFYLEAGSSFNSMHNNSISGMSRGFYLLAGCDWNNVSDNYMADNVYGVTLVTADYNRFVRNVVRDSLTLGVFSLSSANNVYYQNDFIDNAQHASDDGANVWNGSYAVGGNYWSGIAAVDIFSGPDQDIPGSDGVGDTPYAIPGGPSFDGYPLLSPRGLPSSYVDPLAAYLTNENPFSLNATVTPGNYSVVNVSLYYRFSTDNASWGGWTLFQNDSAAPYNWNFTWPDADGYYEFYTVAFDSGGGMEPAPVSAEAIALYDATAPSFSPVQPSKDSVTAGDELFVNFTASEALVADPVVTVNGQPAYFFGKTGLDYSYNYTVQGTEPEAVVTINVTGIDLAGNAGWNDSATVEFDFSPPVISDLEVSQPYAKVGDDIWVRITTNEVISYTNVTIGGGQVYTLWAAYPDLYFNYTVTGNETEGLAAINISVADAAGNWVTNDTATITLDFTLPNVTLNLPAGPVYTDTTVDINATVSDANMNTTDVWYVWNYTTFPDALQLPQDNGDWYAATNDTTTLPDGVYNLTIVAFDLAGNVNDTETVVVTVDHSAPAPVMVTPPTNSNISGLYNVTASAADYDTITFYWYNSTYGWNSIGPGSYDAGTGRWHVLWDTSLYNMENVTVSANASDTLGRWGNASNTNITVDNTPPTITLTAPAAWENVTGVYTIQYTTSSDTVNVEVEYWNGFTYVSLGSDPTIDGNFTWDTSGFNMTTRLRLTATDKANLTGLYNDANHWFRVDNRPPAPTLETPADWDNVTGVYNITASSDNDTQDVKFYYYTVAWNFIGNGTYHNVSGLWYFLWDTAGLNFNRIDFRVNATDVVGLGGSDVNGNISIDNTDPVAGSIQADDGLNVIVPTADASKWLRDTDTTISTAVTEQGSGVANVTMYYTTDGSNPTLGSASVGMTTTSPVSPFIYTGDIGAPGHNSTVKFFIRVVDNVGQVYDTAIRGYRTDGEAPVITPLAIEEWSEFLHVIAGFDLYYSDLMGGTPAPFWLNGTAYDNESGLDTGDAETAFGDAQPTDATPADWSWTYDVAAGDNGNWTINVTFADSVGNSAAFTYDFFEDNDAPEGALGVSESSQYLYYDVPGTEFWYGDTMPGEEGFSVNLVGLCDCAGAGAGVREAKYPAFFGEAAENQTSGFSKAYDVNATITETGTFSIAVYDNVGNVVYFNFTVSRDTDAPDIADLVPVESSGFLHWNAASRTLWYSEMMPGLEGFNATASGVLDNSSGVRYVVFPAVLGLPVEYYDLDPVYEALYLIDSSDNFTGEFPVTVYDNVWHNVTLNFTVAKDTIAPTIDSNNVSEGSQYLDVRAGILYYGDGMGGVPHAFTFTGTASDGGAGLWNVSFSDALGDSPADDVTPASWDTDYTVVAADNGTGWIYIRVYDNVGNWNEVSYQYVEDTVLPNVQAVVLSDPSPVKAGLLEFELTFDEPMNTSVPLAVSFGLAAPYTAYVLNAEGWQNEYTWRGNYTIAGGMDGVHTLNVSGGRDMVYNLMLDNVSFNFTVDTAVATNAITSPVDNSYVTTDFTVVVGLGEDCLDGSLSFTNAGNASDVLYWALPAGNLTVGTHYVLLDTALLGLADGIRYNITLSSTDLAGNTASNVSVENIGFDTSAPVTTHTLTGTLGENGWYGSNVTVSLNPWDATSGVAETYYDVDSTSNRVFEVEILYSNATDFTVTILSGQSQVERTLFLLARYYVFTLNIWWMNATIDFPLFTDSNANGLVDAGDIFSGHDNSGMGLLTLKIVDYGRYFNSSVDQNPIILGWGPMVNYTGWLYAPAQNPIDDTLVIRSERMNSTVYVMHVQGGLLSGNATAFLVNETGVNQTGKYAIHYIGMPYASGNIVAADSFVIDMGSNHYFGSNLSFRIYNGSDLVIDIPLLTNATQPLDIWLNGSGIHNVTYYSVDNLGNVEVQKNVQVKIDLDAPTTIHALTGTMGNDGWYVSPVSVVLTSTDALSQVNRTLYSLDGGPWVNGTVVNVVDNGSHTVRYYSVDFAGNVEGQLNVTFYIDYELPTTSASMSGTVGDNGWYTGAVTVNLTPADAFSGPNETYYSVDGGVWNTGTTINVNMEGQHQVRYYTVDAAGNQEAERHVNLSIDSAAPTTASSLSGTMGANGWYTSPVTVTLGPFDAWSGVNRTLYSLDGGPWVNGTVVNVVDNGSHTVRYYSVDFAGNVEGQLNVTFNIDYEVPTTAVGLSGTVGANGWYTSAVTVTLTPADTFSGPNETYYSVDGGVWNTGTTVNVAAEGQHQVRYYTVDAAGNQEAERHVNLSIDSAAPTTARTLSGTAGDNGWYVSDVSVTLTPTDATSGVNVTRYNVDGGGWQDYSAPFWVAGSGVHGVEYYTVDAAGNEELPHLTVTIRIDLTLPTTTHALAGTEAWNGWYNSSVTVTLTPADTISGVAGTYYNLDGTGWGAGTVVVEGGTGTHTLEYYTVDLAGNEQAPRGTVNFKIDRVDPASSITLAGPGANGWYVNDVTVTLGGTDAESGFNRSYYNLDGGGWQTYAGPFVVAGHGSHWVEYYCTDRANNAGTPLNQTIQIDYYDPATAAALTGTMGLNGWYVSPVTITLTPTDNMSGVAGTYYKVDAGEWKTGTSKTVSNLGAHTLTYYSVDVAGNVEASGQLNFQIDDQAPSTNHALTGTMGGAGWYTSAVQVTLSATDQAGGSGLAIVQYRVDGGAWVTGSVAVVNTEGAHVVEYNATDLAGNVEATNNVTFKLDLADPVTIDSITGVLGNAGYYVSSVTVDLAAADSQSGPDQTFYQLNGGGFVAGDQIVLATTGNYQVDYYSTDLAGHSELVSTVNIDIDVNKPTTGSSVTGTVGASGWYVSGVNVTLSPSDVGSGLLSTWYRLNAGGWQPYAGTFAVPADGVYDIEYNSTDAAGNHGPTQLIQVKVDSSKPTTTATLTGSQGFGGWYRSDVLVSLNGADGSGSGIAYYRYQLDGGALQSYSGGPFLVTAEGTHQLYYYAVDQASHVEVANTLNFSIDKSGPTDLLLAIDGGAEYTGSTLVTLDIAANDSYSGLHSVQYKVDPGGWSAWIPYQSSIPIALSAGDGVRTVELNVRDAANNTAGPVNDTITLDTAVPAAQFTSVPAFSSSTTIALDYTADPDTDFVSLYYSLDGGPRTFHAAYTTSPLSFTAPGDGQYSLELAATDMAGNVEVQSYEAVMTVDTAAPSVNNASFSPNAPMPAGTTVVDLYFDEVMNTAQPLSVSFGMTSPYTEWGVSGNWVTNQRWTGSFTISTSTGDGQHRLRVEGGRDPAGNAMALDISRAFTVDTTAPHVSDVVIGPSQPMSVGQLNVTVTFSEPMEPGAIQVTLGTAAPYDTYAVVGDWQTGNVWNGAFLVTTFTGDDTYRIAVNGASDPALNPAPPYTTGTISIDTTAPVMAWSVTEDEEHILVHIPDDLDPETVRKGDFSVQGHAVTELVLVGQDVTLTVDPPMDTDETPSVSLVGTIQDLAGNSNSAGTSIPADGIAPKLVKARTETVQRISLTFSEPVDPATIVPADFTLATHYVSSLSVVGNVVYIDLDHSFGTGEQPRVTVAGDVSDLSGNSVLHTTVTPKDGVPPVLFSATTLTIETMEVLFSETLAAANVSSGDFTISGNSVRTRNVDGNKVTVTLQFDIRPYDTPSVSVSGSISDTSGNAVTGLGPVIAARGIPNYAPDFISPSVSPGIGYTDETFNFTVYYRDLDNDPPSNGVSLYLTSGSDTLLVPMTPVDAASYDYYSGRKYYALVSLDDSGHSHWFAASDGVADNQSAEHSGPTVSVRKVYGAALSSEENEANVDIGISREVEFELIVKNMGNAVDTIWLGCSAPIGWTWELSENLVLSSGGISKPVLRLAIPENTSGGQYKLQVSAAPENGLASKVFRTLVVNVYKPQLGDLVLAFDEDELLVGQSITVEARLRNLGMGTARNVLVRFYDNGKLIGSTTITVGPNNTIKTAMVWTPETTGDHNIRVAAEWGGQILTEHQTVSVPEQSLMDILQSGQIPETLFMGAFLLSLLWLLVVVVVALVVRRRVLRSKERR